jgi:hypothetical protein
MFGVSRASWQDRDALAEHELEKSKELLVNKLVQDYQCPETVAPNVIALLQGHPSPMSKAFKEIHQAVETIKTESKSRLQMMFRQKASAAKRLGRTGNPALQLAIESRSAHWRRRRRR